MYLQLLLAPFYVGLLDNRTYIIVVYGFCWLDKHHVRDVSNIWYANMFDLFTLHRGLFLQVLCCTYHT